jgi:tRNA modification GTPase
MLPSGRQDASSGLDHTLPAALRFAAMAERDTIYALSSGRPPAAIAVIRISGPRAGAALRALTGKLPSPRKAALARVRDPASSALIDEALALWFPGPHSETGEDIAELQLHGGRAVIAAVLAALSRVEGLRPAEAGEFTRRAFENGKLDLTAVEGLADLVAAETEGQRRQALRQLQGALRLPAEAWREKLIKALALVEARIDFSDEDLPENLLAPALALARELETEIAGVLSDSQRGERLREGLVVAIAGPPNAGKSTLLNRIARREAAIVSPYAGTTRDVIEVHLDLGGWPVTLLDTAGIRETEDPVELEGVKRARARAEAADLVLWVVEAGADDETRSKSLGKDRKEPETWLIRNKIDLFRSAKQNNESKRQNNQKNEAKSSSTKSLKNMVKEELTHKNELLVNKNELEYSISAATGEGFEALLAQLARHAEGFLAGAESALVTRERHRRALEDALAALRRAQTPAVVSHEDLLAEELRIASRALGRLTGRVDVEDILDVIFRDFCIGK